MRNRRYRSLIVLLALLVAMGQLSLLRAEIKLIAKAQIPGNATDLSGLTGTLAGGVPPFQLGGFSAIAYSGKDDIYWLLSDRGPADGQTQFFCRVHKFKIEIPQPGNPFSPRLLETILLKDDGGRQLVGSATALNLEHPARALRFDPEGMRVGRNGMLFLSDEYGPQVSQFNLQGKRTQRLPLPPQFGVAHPSADPIVELAANTSGRQPNAGLEALAIAADGSRLIAVFQRALLQDHGQRDHGENVRIVEIPLNGGAGRQFVYRLDSVKTGVNEILTINDHEFLTIERDSQAGNLAAFKKIMHVDLRRKPDEMATNISQVARLPEGHLPDGIHHVKKEVFIDLLDPRHGLKGTAFPEKHEGICFGPRQGQNIILIAVSDNDFVTANPTTFQIFSITPDELPDFVPQQFGN